MTTMTIYLNANPGELIFSKQNPIFSCLGQVKHSETTLFFFWKKMDDRHPLTTVYKFE